MTDQYRALDHAVRHASRWLESLPVRPVPPRVPASAVAEALGAELPDGPTPASEVIELLAGACEPGLTAMPSGRFYGMVIGGSHPAALAADWLVGAWDQNAVLPPSVRRLPPRELAGCPVRPGSSAPGIPGFG